MQMCQRVSHVARENSRSSRLKRRLYTKDWQSKKKQEKCHCLRHCLEAGCATTSSSKMISCLCYSACTHCMHPTTCPGLTLYWVILDGAQCTEQTELCICTEVVVGYHTTRTNNSLAHCPLNTNHVTTPHLQTQLQLQLKTLGTGNRT